MIAQIKNIKPNVMGTTSFDMKIKGMRKFQNFIIYPLHEGNQTETIKIQSETRIGRINVKSGFGQLSKSHQSGAYGPHLLTDNLQPFQLSDLDLQTLKMQIFASQGKEVGNKVIKTDNSGAKNIL